MKTQRGPFELGFWPTCAWPPQRAFPPTDPHQFAFFSFLACPRAWIGSSSFPIQGHGRGFLQPASCMLTAWTALTITLLQSSLPSSSLHHLALPAVAYSRVEPTPAAVLLFSFPRQARVLPAFLLLRPRLWSALIALNSSSVSSYIHQLRLFPTTTPATSSQLATSPNWST